MHKQKIGSITIIIGAMLLLASILLLVQPLYTFASAEEESIQDRCQISVTPDTLFNLGNLNPGDSYERTITITKLGDLPAYLWVKHEWVAGNPLPGDAGDLFDQMVMTITWRDWVLYSGPLSGLAEPLNLSVLIGPIRYGQTLELIVSVFLPGPETGNEFQGSSLLTRFVFYTQCGGVTDIPPEDPGTDPGPALPPTSGSLKFLFILLGIIMIVVGFLLKRQSKSEAS